MYRLMLLAGALGTTCLSTIHGLAVEKAAAAASASLPASGSDRGYFRSERTMEDIKEAEAALKEKWRNEAKTAGSRFKSGTYTDPNGLRLEIRPDVAGEGRGRSQVPALHR